MEARGQIPVSLPHPHPTKSYWQTPPSDICYYRSTANLPSSADHVIVGSGISGACIAYNLLLRQPNASVVVLEARQACSGATGRNGGHTKAASYRSFLDHERELGTAEAVKIARLEYACMREEHAFIREQGIECASTECETVDVVFSRTQWELGRRAIDRMRKVMGEDDPAARYELWAGEAEVEKRFQVPGAVGAFQYAAGSLSAYEFGAGVLKLGLAKGLNLQTETAVGAIESGRVEGKTTWSVKTRRGSIETSSLILATNGYTAHLLPQVQGLIVPLQGQVVAQRPGTGLAQTGLSTTYSLIWETGYEYMITRPPGSRNEGDIVIGGGIHQLPNDGASRYGNTDDAGLEPTITSYLRRCPSDVFAHHWGEDHPEGRVKQEWSGVMGASADGLPYIGAVPDTEGLYISASFNGHGMVWCFKAAQALVGMMLGNAEECKVIEQWFPQSAVMTKERMQRKFLGRRDLRAPGEAQLGERSRL